MNRVFRAQSFFTAPDGTAVSPFMNATDNTQDNLPWGALADMSIAAGRIEPGVASCIHVHPLIAQVTFVHAGRLCVRMKAPGDPDPYELQLAPGDAVLTQAGTLFQLHNLGAQRTEVLYIASPSYVFEKVEGEVVYDDAVMVAKTWQDISGRAFSLPDRAEYAARRARSLARLSRRKRGV